MWPFEVVAEKGKLKIKVTYQGQDRKFFPEEISSVILSKMKEMAEVFLGYKVGNAVITIPAYFNDSQRQATKDAGIIAGLDVMRIINEPTAAALAYGFNEVVDDIPKNILIYDLGGGTFDISIVSIDKGVFEVLAVAGDTHLGGQDFDNRMVKYLAAEFLRKYKRDLVGNRKSITKLRVASERAKRSLSVATEATIDIDSLFEGIDFQTKISRMRFENLNGDLFELTIAAVEKALKNCKLQTFDIDEIILAGGSTRIPKIRKMLSELFDDKPLNEKINPDEAVAYGAAIQAAMLNGDIHCKTENIQLHDVIPMSLGLETTGAVMSVVVEQNTVLPCSKSRTFSTTMDNQTTARFVVYEGNNPMTRDNKLLGQFIVNNIPRGKADTEVFDVTFDVDENGILNVAAQIQSTGARKNIIINKKRLNKDELKMIIDDAETFRIADRANNEAATAKTNLEALCFRIKLLLEKIKHKIHTTERALLLKESDEILLWIDENPTAPTAQYVAKQKKFEVMLHPIFKGTTNDVLFGTSDIPD